MGKAIDPNEFRRDPSDITQTEVMSIVQDTFGWSLERALEEGMPPPDYEFRGHKFWWRERFEPWVRQELADYKARVLRWSEMLDLKMATNEARDELERQRRQEEQLRWWTDRAGGTAKPADAGGTDLHHA
jgi:hypothetical protein